MPARYTVEHGDWRAAAQLDVRPSKFAYADAMTKPQEALANYLGATEPTAQRTEAPRLTSAAASLNTNGNKHISRN